MKKIIATVLSVLTIISMLFVSVFAENEASEKAEVQFGEDGKLVVLNFTDIQDSYPIHSLTKAFIVATLDKVQPDMVILGGDNVFGKNVRPKYFAKKAIDEFMSIFEERDIKVAAVFGNHDTELSKATKEIQMSYYESYNCFVGEVGFTSKGRVGNYNVPVLSSDGERYAFNFWLLDSGEYNDENDLGGYGAVHADQIEWYKETATRLKKQNGGKVVPSIAFQHIIVPEIYPALEVVEKGTENSIERDGKCYILPENAKGKMNETPCPPNYSNGQFEAMKEMGDVLAMVFGHDHKNSFEVEYEGISLMNTPCPAFAITSYNDSNVGSRVFVIDENNPENFETYVLGFYDVFSQDDAKMKHGFTAFVRDYPMSQRIVSWFIYNALNFGDMVKALFNK